MTAPTASPLSTLAQPTVGLTAAQLAERRTGLGASEVAAVLGLDRYKSPLDVWAEKTGRVVPESSGDSGPALMGQLLEPIVATLAQREYQKQDVGLEVLTVKEAVKRLPWLAVKRRTPSGSTFIGREDWQRASPDRFVLRQSAADYDIQSFSDLFLLECKTKSWKTFRDFGLPGSDQVPYAILCQAIWQADVLELERVDVGVLVDGRDYHPFTVKVEHALALDLYEQVHDWWHRYVVADVEPPVSRGSDVQYLRSKFDQVRDELMPSDPDVEQAVAQLADARRAAKDAEAAEELAKAHVMRLMGDYKAVHTPYGKVSFGLVKGAARTDWKAVAEAANAPAELVQSHTKIGAPSRQFRFTAAAGDN
ncbi:YqaJ viral recombinase family protein [Gemmatimonas sp. UBA7669]|uniref:YqaJ viral recombinase family protein n=1 Tax=Gemmatimonas sp. UBA7669 TaxID=1946568 RepID=UPI0025C4D6BB|nr:YqaJ viral recombinase family protein [Gemmatimonas sp. UBA7669]